MMYVITYLDSNKDLRLFQGRTLPKRHAKIIAARIRPEIKPKVVDVRWALNRLHLEGLLYD